MSSDSSQELKDLYKGSVLTGNLSEIHVKNMRVYPFIFFEGVEEAQLSYDIILQPEEAVAGKKSSVFYKIKLANPIDDQTKSVAIDHLQKSLSILLMQDITLNVELA